MMDNILEVKNLRLSFRTNSGAVKAVRDVSFDLRKGETLAIVGESGSGKSVTSRAIMGILAPNAIIENGEIIYDGKNLLALPEEDFHLLRGDKLSMIFQDPLSSLNPIVRVGKQLTEAMLLNNKERRKSARANLNRMLKLLARGMAEAKGDSAQARQAAQAKTREFARFVNKGIEMQAAYDLARASALEALGDADDLQVALLAGNAQEIREIGGELLANAERARHEFVVGEADGARLSSLLKEIGEACRAKEAPAAEGLKDPLASLEALLRGAAARPAPNYVALGYYLLKNPDAKPGSDAKAIDDKAEAALAQGFMDDFGADIRLALSHATRKASERQRAALQALGERRAVFAAEKLDKGACVRAAKTLSRLVNAAINPLAIQKDNAAYIFESGLESAIRRYFAGKIGNPKELRRVKTQTAKYERQVAAGKDVSKVVPATLVDMEAAQANMLRTIDNARASFEAQTADSASADIPKMAEEMLAYLHRQVDLCARKLTKAEAKHKALALLNEVGIPEPRRRYQQFPFELSGGMRQRVVIAIALSADPDILICDEPTTALDVTIQAQILELINKLKRERGLSIIFITHDLGVVANMADRICVMYAGKIVEYGTADDVFYAPSHPYTWALLASMPDLETKEKLAAIPGTPPNMIVPPVGDAFAPRNQYALQIDFERQPPFFRVSDTHYAATWLLHPDAPKVSPPGIVTDRIERMKRLEVAAHE